NNINHSSPTFPLPHQALAGSRLRSSLPNLSLQSARFAAAGGGGVRSTPISSSKIQNHSRSLFPDGFNWPEIRVPCVVLRLSDGDVFRGELKFIGYSGNCVLNFNQSWFQDTYGRVQLWKVECHQCLSGAEIPEGWVVP
ncbi:serine/threonine-protein kinase WNK (With NoLysine)-related, partial [Striga asiatica]